MATANLDLGRAVALAIKRTRPDLAVVAEVIEERGRQDETWGEQNHPDGTGADLPPAFRGAADNARELCQLSARMGNLTWRHVLLEEVSEAFEAPTVEELRTELVQVAAVCVQWAQAIDRRGGAEAASDRAISQLRERLRADEEGAHIDGAIRDGRLPLRQPGEVIEP